MPQINVFDSSIQDVACLQDHVRCEAQWSYCISGEAIQ